MDGCVEEEEDGAESLRSMCVSVKSEQSMEPPLFIGRPPAPSHTKDQHHRQRAESLGSICDSMKSDQSKEPPLFFRNQPAPSHTVRGQHHRQRAESLGSICDSMKSDQSKEPPLFFRNQPAPSHTVRGQHHRQRAESLGSICDSMKSDQSKEPPLFFRNQPAPSHTVRSQCHTRAESPGSICLSLKSDQSKEPPLFFSNQPAPSHTTERKSGVSVAESLSSCCALCQHIPKDPLSTSCGHQFCRECINSYWDLTGSNSSCPQCGQRPGTIRRLQTSILQTDEGLQEALDEHRISLKRRCELVTEGTEKTGSRTLLNKIFTELYITEGLSEDVNAQHEVTQLETGSKIVHDAPIKCCDIFKALPEQQRHIRVVLTNGVAGVGKTFAVQKFTLDWAEGLENQDVDLLILLSFRELNLIRDERYSLLTLLRVFHPTLEKVTAEKLAVCKPLFIFDGLDESRLWLDFKSRTVVSGVTQRSPVNLLLTNLIRGNLLPSALVWLTSRPAAANQIPPTCVDRVTEVRGFTDAQKDEYFSKRSSDVELSERIVSHIKTSKSLHIMCQIPVFCWISATVLEHMLTTEQRGELPKTLTDLYSHFLLVQTKRKKDKYDEMSPQELIEADRDVLLKLGRLAFEQLEKGNIIFYQEDLERCGLDVTEASVNSGVCTEIFKKECVIFQKTVFCFVHLSVQEFLAAVYMFHCYTDRKTEVLRGFLGKDWSSKPQSVLDKVFSYFAKSDNSNLSLEDFLRRAMEKSFRSKNGHLDLFVRFLHGLCLESNQRILGNLLESTDNSPQVIHRAICSLKRMNSEDISPDRSINVFHCLMEMNDQTVHEEIQEFLRSNLKSNKDLSEIHCSALAYMLQMSEVLDELNTFHYNTSEEGRRRLIPAVRNCRKATFFACRISEADCDILASALKSNPSHLIQLALVGNVLQDSAVKRLCVGLESPNCRLETLMLPNSGLSRVACASLVSALKSRPSHLRNLQLGGNKLLDSGLKDLCGLLQSPHCQLETLGLLDCGLSKNSCTSLASVLSSKPSTLRTLDMSTNKLQDSGVKELCGFLQSPLCQLKYLGLKGCSLSEVGCSSLTSALKSNPSHLKTLFLSLNKVGDSVVKELCGFLESPQCQLEKLKLQGCSLSHLSCYFLASTLKSKPSALKVLVLGDNKLQDSGVKELRGFLESPHCQLENLGLKGCSLSEVSCSSLTSALKTKPSHLKELDLSMNKLQDAGVKELCGFLKTPQCQLEKLELEACGLSEVSCSALTSALKSNPSHLESLNLNFNALHEKHVAPLKDLVESPDCLLKYLRWNESPRKK